MSHCGPSNLTHSVTLWKEGPVGRGDTGGWAGKDLGWSSVGAGSITGGEGSHRELRLASLQAA